MKIILYKTLAKLLKITSERGYFEIIKNNDALEMAMNKQHKFYRRHFSWILLEIIRRKFLQKIFSLQKIFWSIETASASRDCGLDCYKWYLRRSFSMVRRI